MYLIRRVEQILSNLRPVFSRHATYEWFFILIWGILLCSQHRAVTSYRWRCGTNTKLLHPSFALVSFQGNYCPKI
ncbi:MAG: hypothetical protein AAGJ08_28755, partial [Cyanobacteria bacterium P01_H01_bin.35]